MPDIAMCKNETCPMRKNCYRFCAKPGKHQSYGLFTVDEAGGCGYFMPIRKEEKEVKKT